MSQNDFTIANQGFPAFRADLNSALQALASNNSGATEPSTMFANMWWYDSANNIMYIRNEDNDAWIKFAELDQTNDKFVLSGTLQLDDGTVSAPALTFNSDTNMGIYRGGTDILKFVTAGTDAITIDASQNVGIGTSPTQKLDVVGSSANIRVAESGGGDLRMNVSGSTGAIGTHSNHPLLFRTNSTERMRISDGNLLVGHTSQYSPISNGGSGITLNANGQLFVGGQFPSYFNLEDGDGDLILFRKDGADVGSVGTNFSRLFIASNGNAGLRFRDDLNGITPCNSDGTNSDNDQSLGTSGVRFDDAYITNGVTTGSDFNDKQNIETLSDAEVRVATACKGLLRKWKWKSAVAEKGDNARTHFGIIAQDLQDAFTAEGLDAGDYAMFMSNTWWELDGETYETEEEAPEGATENTRLGVRYSELLAFIISAI